MKFLKGLLFYAAVILVGGTMQQVMTIPYKNPIKDGHEFTRDLMAGVVHKAAIEDVFAGIPMFQRDENVFNFRDVSTSDLEKLTDGVVTKYDYNKVREIAWLPALSFSAEAEELEQVVDEFPVEMFELVNEIEIPYVHETLGASSNLFPIGTGYSKDDTFVFFKADKNYFSFCHYMDEKTGELTAKDSQEDRAKGTIREVRSYGGRIFIKSTNGKIYEFVNGSINLLDDVLDYATKGGTRFLKLNDNQGYFDVKRNLVVSDEDIEFKRYANVWRVPYSYRFGNGGVGAYMFNNPEANPEAAAIEIAMLEKGSKEMGVIYPMAASSGTIDIAKSSETNTIWVSKDYLVWKDTGFDASNKASARSHNYFYQGLGDFVKIFQIRNKYDKYGKDNFKYGNEKYTERGRLWQQTK